MWKHLLSKCLVVLAWSIRPHHPCSVTAMSTLHWTHPEGLSWSLCYSHVMKFSSALFSSQCCRILALVQIHESGPDSFQEQTSMSCTRHDTLYTCQNQARPMEHDGGRLLWSNMCEGRLEATTITTYYPKVVPLWILLEIWSLAYEAGWISAILKLCHCEFFWKSGVLVMQLDGFLKHSSWAAE